MQLQQRQTLQAEVAQAPLDAGDDRLRPEIARHPAAVVKRASLGGDHHPLEVPALQRSAKPRLGPAAGIGGSRVKEGDSTLQGGMHEVHRLPLVESLLSPPTRTAEANLGDTEAGAAKGARAHGIGEAWQGLIRDGA